MAAGPAAQATAGVGSERPGSGASRIGLCTVFNVYCYWCESKLSFATSTLTLHASAMLGYVMGQLRLSIYRYPRPHVHSCGPPVHGGAATHWLPGFMRACKQENIGNAHPNREPLSIAWRTQLQL